MPIVVDIDVMLARRKMAVGTLAERVGITPANLAVLKNPPHPNAAKVFVNWLLSKEGQSAVTKALGQPTRRFDVDTKWTKDFGHPSAKEFLTPEKFDELENGSEEVVIKYRKPAMQLAEKLFR